MVALAGIELEIFVVVFACLSETGISCNIAAS